MTTLIFDLDGTLSDPILGISRSINHALTAAGYPARAQSELMQYIGPPLDETFKVLTEASDAEILNLVSVYRSRYSEVGFSENTIYPGIPSTLRELSERDARLGVCTSKRADFAEKILRLFEIREYFGFVSGDDVGVTERQQIAGLLVEGTVNSRALMIGDRAVDMLAAHENGITVVGVLWGYGSRAELAQQSPLRLLEAVDELKTLPDFRSD
ncbi:HAD hydrolase-like protein [Caballeronia sp. LjRoot34]|uniref:HAD hydrolase-like protein n=1 Tax=Caballeronia sp. LjRoot34 TaxID=3342325 RepID=UPI003ECCB570